MRLLIVTQYFSPENFRINDLVVGLCDRGHTITILTSQPNYPNGKFYPGYGWRGPKIEYIHTSKVYRVHQFSRGNGSRLRLALNYLSFAFFASIAVFTRLKNDYDAVFVFQVSPVTVCLPGLLVAKRFGIPIITWILDLWPESLKATGALPPSIIYKCISLAVDKMYSNSTIILVQSRAFINSILKRGISKPCIYYFPNWVEPEYVPEDKSISSTRKDDNIFKIVYAGNIGYSQDFPAMVEAAEIVSNQICNIKFVIAGSGRILETLKNIVKSRGLIEKFEFLGQLPPSSMPALFSSADALLLSLRKDPLFSDTIPGKLQSYMAAGRPILGMLDGEANKIIIESGAGYAVRAGDSQMLANSIIKIIHMPLNEREIMGQRGQEYAAKEFDREKLFNKLDALLLSLHKKTNLR